MDYHAIFQRIRQTVDERAYIVPASFVDPSQRAAMAEIEAYVQRPDFDPEQARQLAQRLHEQGRIDRVMLLSALHVVACHPRVADWNLAARLAGEQELVAMEMGGDRLQDNLASVDRHRGVLAFLRGHYEVALDHFSRALERQRSAGNLQNILCTLIRMGELEEASDLLNHVRRVFPRPLVEELDHYVETDPDLALLRTDDLMLSSQEES